MLQLQLAYVNQADREREVATDLRRRQSLKPLDQAIAPVEPPVLSIPDPRRAPLRTRAIGR